MTRTTSIAFCLVWMLLPSAAADPQPLGDPQAGYVLDIDDGHEWVSEISYSPGITSKLCIERADPAMILCVQSLQRKMALADRAALAQGYFAALEKRYPSKVQPERHSEVFGLLEGQGERFVTTSSELPDTRRWVIAFAGTNKHRATANGGCVRRPERPGSREHDVRAHLVGHRVSGRRPDGRVAS